jgi:GNAT superfamily N-acetyltransferase
MKIGDIVIDVRKYNDNDLERVNYILEEAFNTKKDNFIGKEFYEVVATYDNYVCGYLLLTKVLNPIKNKFYFLVDYVCVDSKYRGMGISDKLMEYAEKVARDNHAMYLQLTCSTFRHSAHKLYERCGYIKRDSDIFRKELL